MSRVCTEAVDALVGASSWAEHVRGLISAVAGHGSSVLITGPTGTGKELIAKAIHDSSDRAREPFMPVDCAALPASLFESQMFGHEKGAFTGASYAAMGCFRAADGGTIFLDEIGELDLLMQAKLLRVLQERHVRPVGSHDVVPVNVRVVAATNRDLAAEVRAGNFREDLFYRLNVVRLESVPLAERTEDILPLSNHFLARLAIENGLPLRDLSPQLVTRMKQLDWPGNVRQLANFIERAVVFSKSDTIGCEALDLLDASAPLDATTEPEIAPQSVGSVEPEAQPAEEEWPTLEEYERVYVQQVLDHTFHNQTAAAAILGISPGALARKIRKLELDASHSRRGRPSATSRIPR